MSSQTFWGGNEHSVLGKEEFKVLVRFLQTLQWQWEPDRQKWWGAEQAVWVEVMMMPFGVAGGGRCLPCPLLPGGHTGRSLATQEASMPSYCSLLCSGYRPSPRKRLHWEHLSLRPTWRFSQTGVPHGPEHCKRRLRVWQGGGPAPLWGDMKVFRRFPREAWILRS